MIKVTDLNSFSNVDMGKIPTAFLNKILDADIKKHNELHSKINMILDELNDREENAV